MTASLQPSELLESALRAAKKIIPRRIFKKAQKPYHYALALAGALRYGFPSRYLTVIAVTGTKGKSSTVEIIAAMLREAGYKTASASSIRFCIGGTCERNTYKMTVPGRFFLSRFLRQAVTDGCSHAVIEMTSEGAVQFRHKGTALDALVFTNLAPEHLESHGGMEAYAAAKLSLARHLEQSSKRPRIVVANIDDVYGKRFLEAAVEIRAPFSLDDAKPWTADDKGARFFWRGELFTSPLPGQFNLENTLAALTLCEALGVPKDALKRAADKTSVIAGRAERVERGQDFTVVVDYAHTPDSLKALYRAFGGDAKERSTKRICVLGSTGGGRDAWKRPAMGAVADEYCDSAYLTDEDPYDEEPRSIVDAVAQGFTRTKPRIVMNRREAIHRALEEASTGDYVLISGKGTDPYIMRGKGAKEPWSDRRVAEEELDAVLGKKS